MTHEQLSFDSFEPHSKANDSKSEITQDAPRSSRKLGGDWQTAEQQRQRDINEQRGEDLRAEQTGVPSVEPELPLVLEDPELNRLWHQEQAEHSQAVKRNIGAKTIKAAQESAARHVARHNRIRGEERKINRRT